eukprot:CAMPEP_0113320328 /NCGR_PEP_ID=MMETSP0010_2-20120614/14190_1 /TAXON_ID=216773 ORGANISM="Corethron hystrix, Strain 308" /NCGR_SAMPLE_ID=MMETSP0010_2 /ASSEMBLY_ACC=CAM_ASM_000155 /LENGTH=376 /DNA_ID=CAMNT_0000178107 /DNA_START=144 /DNA_END=1271 /DNA_ORIENTATION=+ /assembly_acc=CAM_ASM_000155
MMEPSFNSSTSRRRPPHMKFRKSDQVGAIRLTQSSDSDYGRSSPLHFQDVDPDGSNIHVPKSPSVIFEFIVGNLSRCFGGFAESRVSVHRYGSSKKYSKYSRSILPQESEWQGLKYVEDSIDKDVEEVSRMCENNIRQENRRNREDDIILNTKSTEDSRQKLPQDGWDLLFIQEDPSLLHTWSSSPETIIEGSTECKEPLNIQVPSPRRVEDFFSSSQNPKKSFLLQEQLKSKLCTQVEKQGEIFRRKCPMAADSIPHQEQMVAVMSDEDSTGDNLVCNPISNCDALTDNDNSAMPLFSQNQVSPDRLGKFVLETRIGKPVKLNKELVKFGDRKFIAEINHPPCFVPIPNDDRDVLPNDRVLNSYCEKHFNLDIGY